MIKHQESIYLDLVNYFGGQVKTAEALKVKQPAVSYWVRGKKQMSSDVAIRAQEATNGTFKAVDLCVSLKKFTEFSKC